MEPPSLVKVAPPQSQELSSLLRFVKVRFLAPLVEERETPAFVQEDLPSLVELFLISM